MFTNQARSRQNRSNLFAHFGLFLAAIIIAFLFTIPRSLNQTKPRLIKVSQFALNQYLVFPNGMLRLFQPVNGQLHVTVTDPASQLADGETITVVPVDSIGRQLKSCLWFSLSIEPLAKTTRSHWPILNLTVRAGQPNGQTMTEGCFVLLPSDKVIMNFAGNIAAFPDIDRAIRKGADSTWRDNSDRVAGPLKCLVSDFFDYLKQNRQIDPPNSI